MNQITKTQAEQLPAYLNGINPSEGLLQDDRTLVAPPRLKLLQSTSDEVKQGLAKDGEFWSQARGTILVEPVEFIPLCEGVEWMEFDKMGKLLWRTTDPKDPRATFEYQNLNVLSLVEGEPEVITFRGTGMKAGRAFHQEVKRLKAVCFSQRWALSSTVEVSGKNRWYVPVAKFSGFVDGETFEKMKALYQAFKDTFSKVETTSEKGGGTAPNGDVPF